MILKSLTPPGPNLDDRAAALALVEAELSTRRAEMHLSEAAGVALRAGFPAKERVRIAQLLEAAREATASLADAVRKTESRGAVVPFPRKGKG